MVADNVAIGVDLGGTKIAFVLLDRAGTVLAKHQVPTGAADGTNAVIDRIADGIQQLMGGSPIMGVGIGSPGHVNPATGVVHSATNLNWSDVPLVAELRKRLPADLPIILHNDTNAAVLGEMYFGAAQGVQDVVLIAVGTGVGAGAIIGGQIVLGANNFATDIGHLSLNPAGRQCACGLHGCGEMYLSGVGIHAGVREHKTNFPTSPLAQTDSPTTTAILEAARNGDSLAVTVIEEAAQTLGITLAYCGALLNPAMFVIGGGLGLAASDLLLGRAEAEFRRRVLPPIYEHLRIVGAQVTNSAIGAACLVWHTDQHLALNPPAPAKLPGT